MVTSSKVANYIAKLLLFCIITSSALIQASLVIHVGPAQTGSGGSNPIAIPPIEITQYELVWVRPNNTEWTLGISPGLFFGQRVDLAKEFYLSGGFGLAIDQNASGPAIYMAVGYEHCSFMCFNIEYKGATGISSVGLVQPYAIRIGFSVFN